MVDEITREAISTLVDGEALAADAEVSLDRLGHEQAVKRCWERYHLIGEVMRGNRHAVLDADFAERVSEALRGEPTVLAPAPRARMRPWIGLGLAAGLAALAAVVVWPVAQRPAEVAMVQPAVEPPAADTRLADVSVPRPGTNTIQNERVPQVAGEEARVRLARLLAQSAANQRATAASGLAFGPRPARLEPYLINHSEYLGAEMRGLMPYARLISHDVSQR